MILTPSQIKEVILERPNQHLVNQGLKHYKKLQVHMYGHNLELELPAIDGFEAPTLRSLRIKYAQSNKDLMARITRPMDKVFSAKGGSNYFNLQEADEKKAIEFSSDIRSGYSVKQWVRDFWKPHFLDDPAGIIFMEIYPAQKAQIMKGQGKSVTYPTYKSIEHIYDYLPNGSGLEYVVFNVSKSEKLAEGLKEDDIIYRLVDDANDYFVKVSGEDVVILDSHTLPNLFMKVPAILNSNIPNPNITGSMLSPLNEIIELAEGFLLKGSIKVTHDFLHGFPKYWEYADNCMKCGGTGYYEGEKCPECKGTGKSIMTKVSDTKLLTYPQTKDEPLVTPNVAGYVSPDKTYWEIATTDLQLLEDKMNYTIWGAMAQPKTSGMAVDKGGNQRTATEIMTELKPQSDRLHPITEAAEKVHKFIIDSAIKLNINQNYGGSMINYGKRYMLESPDVIWEKYSKARKEGAAASVLDDLLLEYYEAKYDSDPVKLAIQTKLMKVEPFVHLTAQQLLALNPGEDDYKNKLYFTEWLQTVSESVVLISSVDELRTSLQGYTAGKKLYKKQEAAV